MKLIYSVNDAAIYTSNISTVSLFLNFQQGPKQSCYTKRTCNSVSISYTVQMESDVSVQWSH